MADTLIIRNAERKDAKEILRYLKNSASQSDFLSYTPDELNISITDERKYIDSFKKPNCSFFIAEIADEIVGKITLSGGKTKRTGHVAEVSISVDKNHWGKGIGSKLIERAMDWAGKTGILSKLSLKVNSDNDSAVRLYEHFGFREEGRLINDLKVNGKYVDSIIMGKMLK